MARNPSALETILGYEFRDPELLRQALVHPSYAAESRSPVGDNQRLEYLGDAVLQLALTDCLFRRHQAAGEGELTKIRSALSNERALAKIGLDLGLGEFLSLGRGEDLTGGRERESNLGDTFEALLGAMYLDSGLEAAIECCSRLMAEGFDHPEELLQGENPKGELQEFTQSQLQVTPDYRVVRVSGPEHAPQFEVRVGVGGRELASATGTSRKDAEKQAAQVALKRLAEDDER